jgi:hypothetical protein
MSDDKEIVEVEAGMDEALVGGLMKCVQSDEFGETMLGVSKAFERANNELWQRTYKHVDELLTEGANQFPLELPKGFDLSRLSRMGCGIILTVNSFEFCMEGFAELTAMRLEAEAAAEQFKHDNA